MGEKGRLNLGTGAIYDRLKVALQFSDGWGGPDKGFGGDWWYSLTLYRSPLMYGHEAKDISEGDLYKAWIFSGVRVPVILGYEHMVSERSSFNSVIRFHPLNLMNEGGWWLEVHPTYVTRIGERARLVLGVNLIVPGNPMPIRDDGVSDYVDNAQSNLHPRFWEALFPRDAHPAAAVHRRVLGVEGLNSARSSALSSASACSAIRCSSGLSGMPMSRSIFRSVTDTTPSAVALRRSSPSR